MLGHRRTLLVGCLLVSAVLLAFGADEHDVVELGEGRRGRRAQKASMMATTGMFRITGLSSIADGNNEELGEVSFARSHNLATLMGEASETGSLKAGDRQVVVTGPATLIEDLPRSICADWKAKGHCESTNTETKSFVRKTCAVACGAKAQEAKKALPVKKAQEAKKALPVKSLSNSISGKMTNGAKCMGDYQDQSQVVGTLDCMKIGKRNKGISKKCLDNLSCDCFFLVDIGGNGAGRRFRKPLRDPHTGKGKRKNGKKLYTVPTQVVWSNKFGIVTKGTVAKPHLTHPSVGILALKRVKCSKDSKDGVVKCSVFKITQCIFSDKKHFSGRHGGSEEELADFVKYTSQNAWENRCTAEATVKPEWRCEPGAANALKAGAIEGGRARESAEAWTKIF